eukprot:UN06151
MEFNPKRPADSLVFWAAEGKPSDTQPPSKGWDCIGAKQSEKSKAPGFKMTEANLDETQTMRKKVLRDLNQSVQGLCTEAFIYTQTAEIHCATKGLYDYGPVGCALKSNMITQWRNHFVIEEDMLEIESTVLTPHPVLEASGHVAKFSDYMVKEMVPKEKGSKEMVLGVNCYRADKLLEEGIDKLLEKNPDWSEEKRLSLKKIRGDADAYNADQLYKHLLELDIKTENGLPFTKPYEFNLMFGTDIGPTGKVKGYLRPETAQGIFVNFKKLLEFNNQKVPFAAAQIGLSFRNEIAPRNGLLRVREFQQAEIEHFCGADEGVKHEKFSEVHKLVMNFLPREQQTGEDKIIRKSVGEAVKEGMISNETLGFYLAKSQLWFEMIGINMAHLRFRQHKDDEMAHYAKDCWDAEILTTMGWIEVAGHADRACFDLSNHSKATGTDLMATEMLDKPVVEEQIHRKPNKGLIGRQFRQDAKPILEHLAEISDKDILELEANLKKGDVTIKTCKGEFTLTSKMLSLQKRQKKVHQRKFYPAVVEPSFGIGRVLYSLLEHVYWTRPDDSQRKVISLPPLIAPFKAAVLTLFPKDDLKKAGSKIARILKKANISTKSDDSQAAIGRKYSRIDEIGIPFAITIDYQHLEDDTVTIRER